MFCGVEDSPYNRQGPHLCIRLRFLTSYPGKSLLLILIEGLISTYTLRLTLVMFNKKG